MATVYMAKVFAQAYSRSPRMRFDLRLLSPNYLENLDSGEIDLLIIPDAICSQAHPRDVLFTDRFSCVVWTGNPRIKRRVTREQYLQLGHVICEWDGGRMEALDEERDPAILWFLDVLKSVAAKLAPRGRRLTAADQAAR
jgi:DNA-binding transcriptional LysR family regulator